MPRRQDIYSTTCEILAHHIDSYNYALDVLNFLGVLLDRFHNRTFNVETVLAFSVDNGVSREEFTAANQQMKFAFFVTQHHLGSLAPFLLTASWKGLTLEFGG